MACCYNAMVCGVTELFRSTDAYNNATINDGRY